VPAVFGLNDNKEPQPHLADEIAETYRCRQLSTYTQITTLLSVCRLSRNVVQRYIHDNCKHSWPIHRSMGPLYRPRPMDVWEIQYGGDKNPQSQRRMIGSCSHLRSIRSTLSSSAYMIFKDGQRHFSDRHHGNTGLSNLCTGTPSHALPA
jgi:hypothetical protein